MWWTGQEGRRANGKVGKITLLCHLPTSLILPFIWRHGGHPVVGV